MANKCIDEKTWQEVWKEIWTRKHPLIKLIEEKLETKRMNETCSACKGLGEYVGLKKVVPCEACGGVGVQDAKGVLTVEGNQAVTMQIEEQGKEAGAVQAKSFVPNLSAAHELNTWLGKWFSTPFYGETWRQMSKTGMLGLRLPRNFIMRLRAELARCPGPIDWSTRSRIEWTYAGLKFKIFPHVREDWDPEIIIQLAKGEEPCRSEKESTDPCLIRTTLGVRVVAAAKRQAMEDLIKEVQRTR